MASRWIIGSWIVPFLTLIAVCGFSYADATGAFFHFDDYWVLSDAARVRIDSPLDLVRFFEPGRNGFALYRPLSTLIYFRGLHALFGFDPAGYHAVQILFHCLNAILVYVIGRTVLRSVGLGLVTALVYATAPGHAIAVFWMALFTMTGTAFLYLLSLTSWLCLGPRFRALVCLPLFVMALLAGEHAVTLPVSLTLTIVLLEGRWPGRRDWLALAPFYGVAAAYVGVKVYYFAYVFPVSFPDPFQQAAARQAYALSADPVKLLEHLGRYAAFALNVGFPFVDPARPESVARALVLGTVVALAAVAAIVVAWPGRDVSYRVRAMAFGLVFFPVALAPVLGLVDHLYGYYVGIAGLGLALATVSGLAAAPRLGSFAVAGWVALTLIVHATVTWRSVREQGDFGFLRAYSVSAARWLYTVERLAQDHPDMTELFVTRNSLTSALFDDTGTYRLFLPGLQVSVQTVEEVSSVEPSLGRRTLIAPYVFPPGQPWPGSRPQWDWLRCPPVS
ncbi:MAG: hypothetical protein HYR72_18575 [Deltaproteobacteria bacterium]|nr:hypothetical protein [Deltaproteobacteria bacterium]MBI3386273.1 hypothetical protein [Deltaproteobacteria bacterium]